MPNLYNQLSNYSFENHKIRTTLKDSEIWFIAQDVCDCINVKNVTQALNKLDDDERSMFNIGRQGEVNIVNESGMYTLVLRAKDATKKGTAPYRFRKWVTSEVLPTIRKTGSYSLTITTEQQQRIKKAVNERSFRTGEHYQKIYVKLYDHFKIPKYQDLPSSKFNDAIMFLSDKTKYINQDDVITVNKTNLNCLVTHMIWLNKFYNDNKLYQVFKMLGSDFGSRMEDHFQSGSFIAGMFKKDIEATERF